MNRRSGNPLNPSRATVNQRATALAMSKDRSILNNMDMNVDMGGSGSNLEFNRKVDFYRQFFATWLKLDVNNIAAAITIGSTLLKGAEMVKGYITRLYKALIQVLTASVSIAGSDDLNIDILQWIGTHVLEKREPRVLAAMTDDVGEMFTYYKGQKDLSNGRKTPINYLPAFETVWFVHDRNLFLVRRIYYREVSSSLPHEFVEPPSGSEPLMIMTIGRSLAPIKRFLETVRDFADEERMSYITIRASKAFDRHAYWGSSMKRPKRPLETVHLDDTTKNELIADMELYLNPTTRHFYTARGIPYRRGYLLHGPPGTGKTSLCLALATHFRLELYLLHIPSLRKDEHLESLFKSLPRRCMVLLEDIDAVGMQRKSPLDEMEEEERKNESLKNKTTGVDAEGHVKEEKEAPTSRVTLSGLLNVLDGVTSQEGRIVIMTSNFAGKLDKALTRPGRIDRQVYLGNMSPASAKLMFLRMYTPDSKSPPLTSLVDTEYVEKMATEFSSSIPADTFTPAELQGFLITHRHSAANAVKDARSWVEEQQGKRIEEQERAKRLAKWKATKKAEEKTSKENKMSDDKTDESELSCVIDKVFEKLAKLSPSVVKAAVEKEVEKADAAGKSTASDQPDNNIAGDEKTSTSSATKTGIEDVLTEQGSSSGLTPSIGSSETDSSDDSSSDLWEEA